MGTLSGKVALVTGASRGIGAGIARRLAKEGAYVAITYPNPDDGPEQTLEAIQRAGAGGMALQADSARPEEIVSAVDRVVETQGSLDILVNNAGIIVVQSIDSFTMDDFERMMAINVRGVFVATQAALRHMGDGGRIITIGSCNGDSMPFGGGSVYAMTKAAVAGLMRGVARDVGPRGITANTVQPGPTDTDLNPSDGPYAPQFRQLMAVPRFGTVDEIGAMVAYLASPEAAFVTGASLTIDGGFNA